MILDFIKKKRIYDYKKSVIFEALLNYYKDLSITSGIDIPYFMRAKQKFEEVIKSNKDVNYYFDKLQGVEWKASK